MKKVVIDSRISVLLKMKSLGVTGNIILPDLAEEVIDLLIQQVLNTYCVNYFAKRHIVVRFFFPTLKNVGVFDKEVFVR